MKVVAALIKRKDKILLCQRKENDCFGLLWEFPGGKIEKNETLEEAIKREIKEELNLEILPKKLVGKFFDKNHNTRITVYLFDCEMVGKKLKTKECNDYGFFTYKEALSLNLAPVDRKILDKLMI